MENMTLEEFNKLFPNKIPYGYIPTKIENNIVSCIRLRDIDLCEETENIL